MALSLDLGPSDLRILILSDLPSPVMVETRRERSRSSVVLEGDLSDQTATVPSLWLSLILSVLWALCVWAARSRPPLLTPSPFGLEEVLKSLCDYDHSLFLPLPSAALASFSSAKLSSEESVFSSLGTT